MENKDIEEIIILAEKSGNSKQDFTNLAVRMLGLDDCELRYLHWDIANRKGLEQKVSDVILRGAASLLYLGGKLKEYTFEAALDRVKNQYQIFWMQKLIPGPWIYGERRLDQTMAILCVRHRTMDGKKQWSLDFLCRIWGIWYLCDSQQADSLIPLDDNQWFGPMSEREIKFEKELLGIS